MSYKQWGLHYLSSLQYLFWILYRKAVKCCWFHSYKINHFRASPCKWGQDRSKTFTVGARSSSALQTFALFETRFSLKLPKYPTFLWLIHVQRENTIAINQQFLHYFLLIAYSAYKKNLDLEIHSYSTPLGCWGKSQIVLPT